MINTLDDYIYRSLPEWEDFSTNPNLCKKVDGEGNFLPFHGNTVVFLLDESFRAQLRILQDRLYSRAGWMLSRRLEPDTFHMTLHDLVNGPELTPALCRRMEDVRQTALALPEVWKEQPPLRMKTTWLFNMVNTSVVLGLAPADGESRAALSRMYRALETVVPLGYALTPHITMAYYRPGTYTRQQLEGLRSALQPVELEVELRMEDLVYQTFRNMNSYATEDGPSVRR